MFKRRHKSKTEGREDTEEKTRMWKQATCFPKHDKCLRLCR